MQVEQVSRNASNKITMDFSDREPLLSFRFISNVQVIIRAKPLMPDSAFRAPRLDTISYKRNRDTLVLYGLKLGSGKGTDTLLVEKQTSDSLVLYRRSHDGAVFYRFSSKPYVKYRPQFAPDFFTKAAIWKLINSRTDWKSRDGKNSSTAKISMEEFTKNKVEYLLHLANDTLAAKTVITMNRRDTVFYRRRGDTLFGAGSNSEILVIHRQSKDSLTLVQKEEKTSGTTTQTYQYARIGRGQ